MTESRVIVVYGITETIHEEIDEQFSSASAVLQSSTVANETTINSNLQQFINVCAQIGDKFRQETDKHANEVRAEQICYAKMCASLEQKFTAVFHIDTTFPHTTVTQEDRLEDFSVGIQNSYARLTLTIQMDLYHNGIFSLSCASSLRVHITGILYDARAASVGIVSSIGGCVPATTTTTTAAPTTTTTSTNTAPTTTRAKRQQLLLADLLSGG